MIDKETYLRYQSHRPIDLATIVHWGSYLANVQDDSDIDSSISSATMRLDKQEQKQQQANEELPTLTPDNPLLANQWHNSSFLNEQFVQSSSTDNDSEKPDENLDSALTSLHDAMQIPELLRIDKSASALHLGNSASPTQKNEAKSIFSFTDDYLDSLPEPTAGSLYFHTSASKIAQYYVDNSQEIRATAQPLKPRYTYRVRRKILLNEIHYFDHPKLGALIRVTSSDQEATTN